MMICQVTTDRLITVLFSDACSTLHDFTVYSLTLAAIYLINSFPKSLLITDWVRCKLLMMICQVTHDRVITLVVQGHL